MAVQGPGEAHRGVQPPHLDEQRPVPSLPIGQGAEACRRPHIRGHRPAAAAAGPTTGTPPATGATTTKTAADHHHPRQDVTRRHQMDSLEYRRRVSTLTVLYKAQV